MVQVTDFVLKTLYRDLNYKLIMITIDNSRVMPHSRDIIMIVICL